MRWWMNFAAEWTLAHAPGGPWLYGRLRERYGELARLERSSRFDNAAYFVETARRWCGEVGDLRVVEFGTGWVPAVPLALLATGARVDTFDVQRLIKPEFFRRTRDELRRRAAEYATAADLSLSTVQKRLSMIGEEHDFAFACRRLGGNYRAPCDTRRLPYKDGEADLVISNLVLQCIPPGVLTDVLRESARVLRPGGVAVHRIRLTDEYAPCDARRNHLEFLKYTDRTWNRWFNHRLKCVNRLRASQFMEIFRELGFDCRCAERNVDYESIPLLERLELPAFRGMDVEDLATINLDVVLQKPSLEPALSEFTRAPKEIDQQGR